MRLHKILVFLGCLNFYYNLGASGRKVLKEQTITSGKQVLDAKFTPTKYVILAYAAGAINFNELVTKIFNKK